jgi:hypothetical protein
MDYEQQELDLRLDYERDLKDNLIKVVKFTEAQLKKQMEEAGRPLQTVTNNQEAYGISAQKYTKVTLCQKVLKSAMDDFLKLLDSEGGVVQVAGVCYSAALEVAQAAIMMAASESRILADLYMGAPKTPVEDYLEAKENEEAEDVEDNDETETENEEEVNDGEE